jgi:hypothetical protein
MNTEALEFPPMKHKLQTTNKSLVAVKLKKQLLSPICVDIVEKFKSFGLITAGRIFFEFDANQKNILWLDETLFKEALIDLLENALKYSDKNEKIVLSINSSGMHFCRLTISYIHQTPKNEFYSNYFEQPYYSNDRTMEIVSQHQASMDIRKSDRKVTIELSFL